MVMRSSISSGGCLRKFFDKSLAGAGPRRAAAPGPVSSSGCVELNGESRADIASPKKTY